jgi:hypothetical protein
MVGQDPLTKATGNIDVFQVSSNILNEAGISNPNYINGFSYYTNSAGGMRLQNLNLVCGFDIDVDNFSEYLESFNEDKYFNFSVSFSTGSYDFAAYFNLDNAYLTINDKFNYMNNSLPAIDKMMSYENSMSSFYAKLYAYSETNGNMYSFINSYQQSGTVSIYMNFVFSRIDEDGWETYLISSMQNNATSYSYIISIV